MTMNSQQSPISNLKIDPAGGKGFSTFNPLDEIHVGTVNEVGDVQNLVTNIVYPEGKGAAGYWPEAAHAFLTGLILHLQYRAQEEGRPVTLPDVAASLSDPNRPLLALCDEMLENKHVIDRDIDGKILGQRPHNVVAKAARDMLDRAEKERSSVQLAAMTYLARHSSAN